MAAWVGAIVMMTGSAGAAWAQIPSAGIDDFKAPPDPRWGAITAADVEAAYRLIRDNHPGATPEIGDPAFRRALEAAHAQAQARAHEATSYQGYAATLNAFANGLGDKHIWSRPTLLPNLVRWPGMVVSKRGERWVITDTDEANHSMMGAALTACDGIPVAEFARRNLGGYRAVWRIGAQQIQAAPWLLIDEENPFIARPKACDFETAGGARTMTLDWLRAKRVDLLPRLQKAVGAGAAGFGLRKVGDGYWIAMEDLDAPGKAVAVQVAAEAAALRAAPFVVLDLRGNGGGSSLIGREVAAALFGKSNVEARLGSLTDTPCGGGDGTWRASAGNIANLEFLLELLGEQNGPEFRKIIGDLIVQAKAAHAKGQPFSGPTHCDRPPAPAKASGQPDGMKGRLIVLTDNKCFSSCLVVVDDFRSLGAYQVGQATDAATRYSEVREIYLPSGYSMFSTLQAVQVDADPDIGPFEPALAYDGDIADTAALERWVTGVAVRQAGPARP
ncbi:S41 family peptidase [Phenylobacterium sp.]|uniref:S41 family peptidase n=1 Tax=Phenylobacterium sp. TaxID=1871053 RepID=UPI0025FE01BD|nr:S41 family peptidase [Phenylobacterium sp.]